MFFLCLFLGHACSFLCAHKWFLVMLRRTCAVQGIKLMSVTSKASSLTSIFSLCVLVRLCVYVNLGSTHRNVQGLVMVLSSGITACKALETIEGPRFKLGHVSNKQLTCYSIPPACDQIFFKNIFKKYFKK